MQPIFLIGFMGSGKSTLGQAVSKATGLQFIDLDNYIECRFHANVRDIFALRGEDGFRDIERRMLNEVCMFEDVIVACGGGTPCFFDNMDVMNRVGATVYMSASIERLHQRLKFGRSRRPLIASMSDDELLIYIKQALDSRMQYYSKAKSIFNADMLDDMESIKMSVQQFVNQYHLIPIQ